LEEASAREFTCGEDWLTRLIIGILVVIYLIGVGVELAPTVKANWNNDTTSQFFASVVAETPRALA
jgi:hypothetical protein